MSHTFLQLVQQLALEVGTGSPTTVVGQTGESARLVSWVNNAWFEIQSKHDDWDFLRTSFSAATVNQQATYTPVQLGITDFGWWKQDTFRISTTSSALQDEMLAIYMDYDRWRNLYQYGAMRTTYTRPVVVTITPDKQLGLGPIPDATGYTVAGEYYRTPTALAADIDVPVIPDKFWMMAVYGAMMSYAGYESAPEVYARGKAGYDMLMARCEVDQLPSISFGEPLA